MPCPIPGCNRGPEGGPHLYTKGTTGWANHVGPPQNHPYWHRDVQDPDARRVRFEQEFPQFFANSRTPNRRALPAERSPRLTPHYLQRVVPSSTVAERVPEPAATARLLREEPDGRVPTEETVDLPARLPYPYKFCPHCGKRLPPA